MANSLVVPFAPASFAPASFGLGERETLFLTLGKPFVDIGDSFGHDHSRAGVLHSLDVGLLQPLGERRENMVADGILVNHNGAESGWVQSTASPICSKD